jgi:hypothetical protein
VARRELTTNGLAEVSSGTAFPFGPANRSRSERRKREAHEPFEPRPNLPRIARRRRFALSGVTYSPHFS